MTDEHTEGGINIDSDFSLDDEYKPDPLAPIGNYLGSIAAVAFEPANQAIAWKVVLGENGGVMSDGETPLDGQVYYYRNWLPRPGDENEMTASGRSSKRQAKINMMKQFADGMKINMDSPSIIASSIEGGEWVGLDVIVSLNIEEYQGRVRNTVTRMVTRETDSGGGSGDDDIPF